jgi:LmbE family N-acetylglucosaminyl deacetylase
MKYLFIGAHADEELCFAGTMAKMSEQGHETTYIAQSWCGSGELLAEFLESVKILNVSKVWPGDRQVRHFRTNRARIADYFSQLNSGYDYVFTHSTVDRHPDHRTVAEESKRVFTGNLITYIGPWNGNEDPNYFIEISEQQLEKKIHALSCYKSQSHRAYMNVEFIRAQARYNGIKCGKEYAEAFRIERLVQ